MIVDIALIFPAHGLQVPTDGPQLHARVLGPRNKLVVETIYSRIDVAPPVDGTEFKPFMF